MAPHALPVLHPHYTIHASLGEGGMGNVYRATDRSNDTNIVIKHGAPSYADHYRKEFRILSELNHPCIPGVHDFHQLSDGSVLYTMDDFDGKSLDQWISDGLVDERIFFTTLYRLLETLKTCHARGVLHNDIKPQNILIRETEAGVDMRLIDFGLARYGDDPIPAEHQGTVQYTAPEILKKEPYDQRADLYALGIVLYETASGINPFHDANVVNVVVNHIQKKIGSVEPKPAFLDRATEKIILKLLEKDPGLRYQNTAELYRDLQEVVDLHPEIPLRSGPRLANRFIGREKELQSLKEKAATPPSGFREIHLTGEAGVGKTTLIRVLKMDLQLEGADVCIFSPAGPDGPHANTNRFLRLIGSSGVAPMPDLGKIEELSKGDIPSFYANLSDAALQSVKPGRVIIVDHWEKADGALREFFSFWFRKCRAIDLPITVVVVGADAPEAESPDEIILTRFDKAHSFDMIQKLLHEAQATDEFCTSLFEKTQGHPLLIEEILSFALEHNHLRITKEGWRFTGDLNVLPGSLHDWIIRKTDGLDPEDQALVRIVSIFPGNFSAAQASSVHPGLKESRLRSLTQKKLLQYDNGSYRFSDPTLRDHLVRQLDPATVKNAHTQAALHFQSAGSHDEALAYHYFRSDDPSKALPFLLKLAARKKKELLLNDALVAFQQAISIMQTAGNGSGLFETLTQSEQLADQTGNRSLQYTLIQSMIDVSTQGGFIPQQLQSMLRKANYLDRISDAAASEMICKAAITLSGAHGNVLLGELYRQLGKSFYRRAMWDDALAFFRQALDEAIRSDHAKNVMDCYVSLGNALGSMRQWDDARTAFEKALAAADQIDDDNARIAALFNLGFVDYSQHRLQRALDQYERAEPLIRRSGLRRYWLTYYQYGGFIHVAMHAYELARDRFEKLLEVSTELNQEQLRGSALRNLGLIYCRLGHCVKGDAYLEGAMTVARGIGNEKDLFMTVLYATEGALDKTTAARRSTNLQLASRYLDQHPNDELSLFAQLSLLRLTIDHQAGNLSDWDLTGLAERIEKAPTASLRILGLLRLSQLARLQGDLVQARTFSGRAVSTLSDEPFYEFAEAEIWFNHYRILSGGASREDISKALERAYQALRSVESTLKDSDLRTSYLQIPLHQEIVSEYQQFFSEERESDIQSFHKLYEIARDINSILESEALFERIMDGAIGNTQSDRGLILIKNPDSGLFDIQVARNVDSDGMEDLTNISHSIIEEVFQTGQSLVTADANRDDRFKDRKSIVAYQIRSIMCVPLRIKDRMIGAVYVDKRFDSHYFSPNNVRFLESFANLAAVAIQNARLFENIRAEKDELERENIDLRASIEEKFIKYSIVGQSKAVRQIHHLIESAAANTAPVLIQGESGTGKELVARAIHFNGPRKKGKFVPVDCGAMPESLLESELFGYKKGAFTGASTDKKGLFEEADGGTIFLDEITNTSLNFQARLLRVIQEGEIRRVGDTANRKVDVRIVSATNRSLADAVKSGTFREDLFYRLNVMPILVPPLRDRKDDVPLLVQFFVSRHAKQQNKTIDSVSEKLMDQLIQYAWPGNIRELDNLVNRMVIFATKNKLTTDHLPDEIKNPSAMTVIKPLEEFEQDLLAFERQYFDRVLKSVGGNKSQAAEILSIKRTTLNDRLKKLGL